MDMIELLRVLGNITTMVEREKLFFHIVGTTMRRTDNLISDLGLSDICLKYGPKVGDELDDIYDKANIGIGCLANHRIGSKFGSALKTKEYIAKGFLCLWMAGGCF